MNLRILVFYLCSLEAMCTLL